MWLSCALCSSMLAALSLPAHSRSLEGAWAEGANDAWQRLDVAPPPSSQPLMLVEGPGSVLEVKGGRLVRKQDGREIEIDCLDPEGTGEIRGLALDPAGLVFVAAARGVFVLSADVTTLDRIPLGDGAPRGVPTSVCVDARRRVWIATEDEIGGIDPSFYWGRTLSRDDGLPGGGPYRLRTGEDGALLVECDAGLFRYSPDRGAKPAVIRVAIDGEPWTSESVITRTAGDVLRLVPEGRAAGGATFRYRIDGHHVWRALDANTVVERIPPGAHTLDVIALDRDLNRSNPARIKVRFQYPFYYDKRFVLPCALTALALTSAFFLVRARRQGGGRAAWARALVSAALAFVLGVQILAGLVPHAKGWPFIGFSMYTNTYREGSIIYDGVLTGIEPAGGTRRLDFNALGHLADDRWQVLHPIIDGGDPVAREWVEAFNARFPHAAIAGLQARADRRRLTPYGAVRIAPLILSAYTHKALHDAR